MACWPFDDPSQTQVIHDVAPHLADAGGVYRADATYNDAHNPPWTTYQGVNLRLAKKAGCVARFFYFGAPGRAR
jgi:hypothetical protein